MSYFKIILVALLVSSCTTQLADRKWAKEIINFEYVLAQNSVIVNIDCTIFDKISPKYGVQTEKNYRSSGIWSRAGCNPKIEASLSAGERINITGISIRTDATGSCWQVRAKNQSGMEFFIPSCKFFHTNLWVTPPQPTDNGVTGLRFDSSYLLQRGAQ